MHSLYDEVRSSENLFSAWRHVRKSAFNSSNNDIRGSASEFEHRHQTHIRTIQAQLRERRFRFEAVEGVLKDKKKREAQKKKPRPIVISSVRDRVVQRAILQVLQPRKVRDASNPYSKFIAIDDPRLGKLNRVNKSPFGIGGLMAPFGGVKQGIGKVMQSMNSGAKFFFQSNIKAFFTQIPIDEVTNIIFSETSDDLLSDLFRAALTIELGNKDELKGYSDIFPRNGIGVAQGSSLSAFAGNVLLYDLDHELNTSSVTAIRYIDDLFMLSDNQSELANAVSVAKAQLTSLGFSLYEPAPGSTKAAEGNCASGFNLLGCSIQPNRCLPSTGSKQKLIEDIRTDISKSKSSIKDLAIDPSKFDLKHSRSATIKRIGDRLYGWQKSFAFCTHADVFASVDERIAKFILDYDHAVFRLTNSYPMPYRMMALGIPNLAAMPLNK